jgi:4-amino-4-deoxy-L-arabinose transferase-like glycosyltransferase
VRESLRRAWGKPFWRRWLPLCLIILGGMALRAYTLGAQNVWWDEALAIWARRKGFIGMTLWTASDVHPPLFFWSLFGITRLAGESEYVARFPSLIYGVLTIPLTYQLGRRLVNGRVALLSALLISMARFHVWWSQEMRMYMLAGLLGTASLYFAVRWWEREERGDPLAWRSLVPYGVATLGALLTIYLSVFVMLVTSTFAFVLGLRATPEARKRLWWRWALAQIAVLFCFAPWLALALPRMNTWSSATPFSFRAFALLYATALSLGISTDVKAYLWLTAPVVALSAAGLLWAWIDRAKQRSGLRSGQAGLLLALCLSVPPLAVFALSQPRGLFYSPHVEARYLLPFAPPFYLLLAWGIDGLWRRRRAAGIVLLALLIGIFAWMLPQHYHGRYLRDELQSMVRTLEVYARPGDTVALVSGNRYPVFDYYYSNPSRGGAELSPTYLPSGVNELTAENVAQQLGPLLDEHERIWLAQVETSLQDPDGLSRSWLAERLPVVMEDRYGHNGLILYAKDGQPPALVDVFAPQHPLDQPMGDLGMLAGFDLATTEFGPGDAIRPAVYWQGTKPATLRLVLRDAQGRTVVGQDANASGSGELRRWTFGIGVPSRMPRGGYQLDLAVLGDDGQVVGENALTQVRVRYTEPWPGERVEHSLALVAGDGIELQGYGLAVRGHRGEPTEVEPGETLELTLLWGPTAKVGARYTVFTHLVGEAYNPATNGPVWAQHDAEPLDGGWPTTYWMAGDVVPDVHLLEIPANTPPGVYRIAVGLYPTGGGERLPIFDGAQRLDGDRALLVEIVVRDSN